MEEQDRREQKSQEKDTTPVTTSVRISPATKGQMNDLVKQLGFDNQDQLLNHLFRLHDTNQVKAGMVGRETEIESFESYLNGLFDLYKSSLRTCQDAEIRIKDKFEAELVSNGEIIRDLQKKLKDSAQMVETLITSKSELEKQWKAQESRIEQITRDRDAANASSAEYKKKNDALIDTVTEFKNDHEKVVKMTHELLDLKGQIMKSEGLVEEANNKIAKLVNEKKACETTIEELQKQTKELLEKLSKLQEDSKQQLFEKEQEKAKALMDAREQLAETLEMERKKSREEYAELLNQFRSFNSSL